MQSTLYTDLQQIITEYYDPGKEENSRMSDLVADKIDTIDNPSEWSNLIDLVESSYGEVEDFAFMQFPNRELKITSIEPIKPYRVDKNLTVCLSLLCPYYTMFYDYSFGISTTSGGFLELTRVCFLNSDKFALITRKLNVTDLGKLVEAQYPGYQYANHYQLMTWSAENGLPFKTFPSDRTKYTFYEYLFDPYQPDKVYP